MTAQAEASNKLNAMDILLKWVLPLGLTMVGTWFGARELTARELEATRRDLEATRTEVAVIRSEKAALAARLVRLEDSIQVREGDTYALKALAEDVADMKRDIRAIKDTLLAHGKQ